ncbi:nuclear transport factor 2 family protein [Paraflavisolibacter sp. H34]|uniref:nuclear transport factor 2 family protein n=1 Tax=Huijunlia imazamoxiresistens TaxID=3127457 RepID=UPI003018C227
MKKIVIAFLTFFLVNAGIRGNAQETKVKAKPGEKEVKVKGETEKLPKLRGETELKSEPGKIKAKGQLKGEGAHAAKAAFSLDLVRQEVLSRSKAYAEDFSRADSVAMLRYYHSEARVYPPNMASGEASTIGHIAVAMPQMGSNKLTLNPLETVGGPELVVETGTYQLTGTGGQVTDNGKYMNVWKLEKGQWKIYREMWNSDLALPGTMGEGQVTPGVQQQGNMDQPMIHPQKENLQPGQQPMKKNPPSGGNK